MVNKKNFLFNFFLAFAIVFSMQTLTDAKEEIKEYRQNELVELIKLAPSLKLDIRYATKNNFLGYPVYKEAKAFLQKPVAESLIRVNKSIQKDGYGLLVFDGYRPWSVTKLFWDKIEPGKRKFVADPKTGSIHNRGCAVDLSLYDLKTRKEVKMPCEYDTFSEVAYPTYSGGTIEEHKNRDYLIKQMEKEGFKVHSSEWWHFDHEDCGKYKVLDLSFDEVIKNN